MAKFIQLVVLSLTCYYTVCSYSSSYSISDCITYESSSSYKWCRYTSTTYGYKCTASDYSYYCGGSSYYRCSDDSSSYLPQNAKKLLCPSDSISCYSQTAYLYSSTSYETLYSNYFGTSTFCWYKFIPYSSYIKSINIKINSLTNAKAEVYYESSTNNYDYKGSVSSGGSMDVDVSYYDPVWVLVIPSSSSAYVSVKATASSSSSSYSSSSSILAAILVPVLCCATYFIIIIVIVIVCRCIQKRNYYNSNNIAAASIAQPSPHFQQQIYYPPQQDYSNTYVQNQPVIMGAPQPAYPSPVQPQQMYVLEPAPMHPSPQMSYGPSDPVSSNSVYVHPGISLGQPKYA